MSERTGLVPQLANLTYTHTLVIESTHERKVHEPCGSWKVKFWDALYEYFQ